MHLPSTCVRLLSYACPLARMRPGFPCPNHSKFLTTPLLPHPCVPSIPHMPPFLWTPPSPCAPPVGQAHSIALDGFSVRALFHQGASLMDNYISLQIPFNPLWTCLHLVKVLHATWGFHACPRRSTHTLGLPCMPCGISMHLGASVHTLEVRAHLRDFMHAPLVHVRAPSRSI
jgi:hypothetical protein